MVALSRIKNITNEQEWMKILRKAKDSIVLVEFASSTSMGIERDATVHVDDIANGGV